MRWDVLANTTAVNLLQHTGVSSQHAAYPITQCHISAVSQFKIKKEREEGPLAGPVSKAWDS